jgi:hypothetical protein
LQEVSVTASTVAAPVQWTTTSSSSSTDDTDSGQDVLKDEEHPVSGTGLEGLSGTKIAECGDEQRQANNGDVCEEADSAFVVDEQDAVCGKRPEMIDFNLGCNPADLQMVEPAIPWWFETAVPTINCES